MELIKACVPKIYGEEIEYVNEAMKSGWISGNGKYCQRLEKEFAEYMGTKYCVAVSNGTTAIHLALVSAGIKEGDEVIVSALVPVFSVNPILWCKAVPVLIDVDKETWNMDVSQIEQKITPKTKAILVVHLYGNPANMDAIMDIAKRHNLMVIEDAAEAIGAEWKGKKVGSIGKVGTFSLYANKAICCGEGGLIVTDDDEVDKVVRHLRNQGRDGITDFIHSRVGYNYRLADILAAFACGQMKHIEESVQSRIYNAFRYQHHLMNTNIVFPRHHFSAKNSYWMTSILLPETSKSLNRDEIVNKLDESHVETRHFFTPIHMQPCYGNMFLGEKYPIAENISVRGINLPSGNDLSEDQIKCICDNLKEIIGL